MPYAKDNMPDMVKKMPTHAQDIWRVPAELLRLQLQIMRAQSAVPENSKQRLHGREVHLCVCRHGRAELCSVWDCCC